MAVDDHTDEELEELGRLMQESYAEAKQLFGPESPEANIALKDWTRFCERHGKRVEK